MSLPYLLLIFAREIKLAIISSKERKYKKPSAFLLYCPFTYAIKLFYGRI